jgi:hypothetical protein
METLGGGIGFATTGSATVSATRFPPQLLSEIVRKEVNSRQAPARKAKLVVGEECIGSYLPSFMEEALPHRRSAD